MKRKKLFVNEIMYYLLILTGILLIILGIFLLSSYGILKKEMEEGIDVKYEESPGMHDWTFWNQQLEASIQWLLDC